MEKITKPSINRLAKRAGVKSLSEDCYDTIRNLIGMELNNIIKTCIIVNSQNQTKTIMVKDLYNALHLLNHNVTESTELNNTSCMK
jgi:histone H3/H4